MVLYEITLIIFMTAYLSLVLRNVQSLHAQIYLMTYMLYNILCTRAHVMGVAYIIIYNMTYYILHIYTID